MADPRLCSIPECGKSAPSNRKGWCNAHYYRWRKHGDPLGGGPLRDGAARYCSVQDCEKPYFARGWCRNHYALWFRNGAPDKARPSPAEQFEYIKRLARHQGDECVTWPYTRTKFGYGRIYLNGKTHRAHRLMCIEAHGEPPSPDLFAVHACGKGHLGCVNPKHLRWATQKENSEDSVAHGTTLRGRANPKNILSEDQVREIRSLAAATTQKALARQFGVSKQTISLLLKGGVWGWLD